MDIPDDPIISYMERTGYPPYHKHDLPVCPICGAECEFLYKDAYHEIVGCNDCLTAYDAEEEDECFPWRDEE